ncbi:hypothetical protein COOONC_04045 [Cooperia oncophora]
MDVKATFTIRILASLVILVPVLCGFVLQALLGIALYSLMWCDVCALTLDLFFAFPLTLTGVQYMGDSMALYYIPLVFEGIAFNGIYNLSLLLTVNRFLLFIFPRVHNVIFTTKGTKM